MFWRRALGYGGLALAGVLLAGAAWIWAVFNSARGGDPSQKATRLAQGIAQAVNCTAFLAVAAVVAVIAWAWLSTRRNTLRESAEYAGGPAGRPVARPCRPSVCN
jgi:hypothetical protein